MKSRADKKAESTKTVFDKYEEKRKEKRKAKKKGQKEGRAAAGEDEDEDEDEGAGAPFNDPFFSASEMQAFEDFDENPEAFDDEAAEQPTKKTVVKSKKKKVIVLAAEYARLIWIVQAKLAAEKKAAEAKEKAELELLLMDEDDAGEAERGFDMGDIESQVIG